MNTLRNLKKMYCNAPKMLAAINRAIIEHGEEAEAVIAKGRPSHKKGSNCQRTAAAVGWSHYAIYSGARRRYRSEGYTNVLVRLELS